MKINPGMSDAELMKIFQKIDVDKSGTIEKGELGKALAIAGFNASESELNAMFYAGKLILRKTSF